MQMFAILSGYVGDNAVRNVINHDDLVRDHVRPTPYAFREIIGSWQNQVEQAVQVLKPEGLGANEFIDEMIQLGNLFDQEAILVVHSDGSGNLFYQGRKAGQVETVPGRWQELTLHKVIDEGNWSFIRGEFYGFDD